MRSEDVLSAAFPAVTPDSSTSFYGEVADLYTALALADLFWPACLEVHDAVFLAVGANSQEWVEEGVGRVLQRPIAERRSWSEIVDSFNWFEVPYLFGVHRDPAELRGEAAHLLAGTLRQSWSARLRELYPSRTFDVSIEQPTKDEALSVSVRQMAPTLVDPRPRLRSL